MKWLRWLAVLGVVAAVLPLAVTFLAYGIAQYNGCTLNEGNPHPCVIWGADRGQALYNMGVMFWLTMMTLPLAVGAIAVWLVAEILAFLRRRRAA